LTSNIFVRQLPYNLLLPRDTMLGNGLPLDYVCPSCLIDIEHIDNMFLQGHIIPIKEGVWGKWLMDTKVG